jgi:hypothetical protein
MGVRSSNLFGRALIGRIHIFPHNKRYPVLQITNAAASVKKGDNRHYFHSVFTGTQPKTSAPDNNPRTALIGGLALGLMTEAISLYGFWWLFFR